MPAEPETLWPGRPPLAPAEQAALLQRLTPDISRTLSRLRIDPAALLPAVEQVYLPLAAWVAARKGPGALVLGISGGQGSGKSTLTEFLGVILERGFGLRVAALSLDDIYLTRVERERLAGAVHPLLMTRGVPGTHDVALGIRVIDALRRAGPGDTVPIPSFDKATDDRRPERAWPRHTGRADVIMLEGWCLGALPEEDAALREPINQLEATEDKGGRWRRYVNDRLRGEYRDLWAQLDVIVMLEVPGMDRVFEWRWLQERKLAESHATTGAPGTRIMDEAGVRRFVMYYERTTRHLLAEMPGRADVVLHVNQAHQIDRIAVKHSG
jgi:D-glycerate 3-kinase